MYIGKWAMHIFKTTHKQYKDVLKDWFKGKGGGSGLVTEVESWDSEKFKKYEITTDTYDHTDIMSRPPVLMNLYAK